VAEGEAVMSLPDKAVKILRDVQKCILMEPELYDQGTYPDATDQATCDTPCCIAGWVEWCAKPSKRAYNQKLREMGAFDVETMAETLGIDHNRASLLFSSVDQYGRHIESAKQGSERIEAFIASGGAR
jgi:hypothetical protein